MTVFKLLKYITDENYRFSVNAGLGKYNGISDEEYIIRKYRACFGKPIDIEATESFNEKLQWLKLYDRNPEYTVMVDKYQVRNYIENKIGAQYLIPLIGVWNTPDEIDFNTLPNQFVIKCNHNSGLGMCICKDKQQLNIQKVKKELNKGLKQDYYLTGREWPYKDVPRKIIAEQFLQSDEGGLTDYKVHCFNGVPKLVLVCKDRFTQTGLTEDFFSENWEHLDIRRPSHPNNKQPIPKPDELDEMLELAGILSKGIPFLRADFYIVNHKIYFSELTFFPASGFEGFESDEWDFTLGSWLTLSQKFGKNNK